MERNSKRKAEKDISASKVKHSKLNELIFYDGNRHPAGVLHDLRPDISADNYRFQSEEAPSRLTRYRCDLTIDQNQSESIFVSGFGRSKQLAKNMAAQVKSFRFLFI